MQAFWAMTMPKAPAVKMDMITSFRSMPFSSIMVRRQPGRMPQLPAVGVATIRPMEALQPATDRARAMAWSMMVPDRPPWVRDA